MPKEYVLALMLLVMLEFLVRTATGHGCASGTGGWN